MLRLQYRMHPAIRAFPSAYFYEDALLDADSILIRPQPWYLDTPPAAAAAEAPAAGPAAAVTAASILSPADPRLQRRSPTPEQAAAAAGARAADAGGGSSSLLLPYALFNVSGVEHSVGRSKANTAEADLAVELYCQLRPALLVRSVAAAAEAAARQELLLALPTDVSRASLISYGKPSGWK
jgi:superfamily I DNA and/or RNA helicase